MITKSKKFTIYVSCLLLLTVIAGRAQFYNEGIVQVKPNTIKSVHFDFINSKAGDYTNDGDVYIHADWTNNGKVDFTTAATTTGNTEFSDSPVTGVAPVHQDISGDGKTNYYDAVYDNSSNQPAFSLRKEINIYGEATYMEGVVDEENDKLTIFQNDATHVSTSDDSFVDGKVRKIGDDQFTFPIGGTNGTLFRYRPAGISAPSNPTDVFTARYYWKNSAPQYSHASKDGTIETINDAEYWDIERTASASDVDVTLTWHSDTTPATFLNNLNDMVIVRWDATTSSWKNEGGTTNLTNKTISTTPSGYGIFTFALQGVSLSHEIPNGFSPGNGDGMNDVWNIFDEYKRGPYPDYSIKIYDRWGNLVYDYENDGSRKPEGWDGKSRGRWNYRGEEMLPAGTYFYILSINEEGFAPRSGWVYLTQADKS